ncbi:C40 family peptidase [Candidatus Parcubacteria bacterium]|nr:C40 family peptidase [Candidatus Parcubacteria bacterium]
MAWIYRVGLLKSDVDESLLKKSELKYEEVEVETALRAHIDETLGKPYKLQTSMREDAPNFFSCSSLPSYLYVFAGVFMPSLVIEKFNFTKPVTREELRFGDFVYSFNDADVDRKSPNHMGIYMGDGKILQAAGYWYKGQVLIEDLDKSPSFENIVGYGRVVDDLSEKRYVVEIPEDRPDLQNKNNLIKELEKYGHQ